jgi:hypothetical protein
MEGDDKLKSYMAHASRTPSWKYNRNDPRILLRIIISEIFMDADMRTVDGNVRRRAGSVDQWRHDH